MVTESPPTPMLVGVRGDPNEHYPVPQDAEFSDDDAYLEHERLQDEVRRLIDAEFSHLREVDVRAAWKRKGGQSQGQATLGACLKATGLIRHWGRCHFVVWLAADHARERRLTNLQVEAILHHELSHAWTDTTDDGELRTRTIGHNWEGFSRTVRRYGPYLALLEDARRTFIQPELPLFVSENGAQGEGDGDGV